VMNEYGEFRRFDVMDHDWSMQGNKRNGNGTWSTADGPGKIAFSLTGSNQLDGTYYGLYKIDETGGRVKLSIE
jgi:hypothetical protein